MSSVLRTVSGRMIDLTDVQPGDIHIEDVAHHLSHLCRYTGAVPQFYSVAQHSVLVAALILHSGWSKRYAFAGLMHDVPEYLLGDCSTPLKRLIPEYQRLEEKVWDAAVARFNVSTTGLTKRLVGVADQLAWQFEEKHLRGRDVEVKDSLLLDPFPGHAVLKPTSPAIAKESFLAMFANLTEGR